MKINNIYQLNNGFINVVLSDGTQRILKTYTGDNNIIYFDLFCYRFKLSDFIKL